MKNFYLQSYTFKKNFHQVYSYSDIEQAWYWLKPTLKTGAKIT